MVVASAVRAAVAPRLAPRARPDRASRAECTIRRVARDGDAPPVLDGGASPTHPRRRDVLASLASAASAAALAPVLPASASLAAQGSCTRAAHEAGEARPPRDRP